MTREAGEERESDGDVAAARSGRPAYKGGSRAVTASGPYNTTFILVQTAISIKV